MSSEAASRPMFGGSGPLYRLKQEKAKHRLIGEMALNGFSNIEIAKMFDVELATIVYTLKQPWLREYMTQRAAEAGDDERERIAIQGRAAMARIVDMSETARQEAVKLAANKELVNRWLGATPQVITHINKKVIDQTDEELLEGVQAVLKEREHSLVINTENE